MCFTKNINGCINCSVILTKEIPDMTLKETFYKYNRC